MLSNNKRPDPVGSLPETKMKRWCLLFLTLAASLGACASESNPKRIFVADKELSFAVPATVTVSEQSPVTDFVLFQFRDSGKIVLSAYAGNAPDFPSKLSESAKRQTAIGGFPAEERLGRSEAPYLKEILVSFPRTNSLMVPWPMFVHFTVERGSPDQVRLAEEIIASMRREEPAAGKK